MEEVSKRDHGWCPPLLPYAGSVPSPTSRGASRSVAPCRERSLRRCSRLLPRPSRLLRKSCLSKGTAAAEAHACMLELLKPG